MTNITTKCEIIIPPNVAVGCENENPVLADVLAPNAEPPSKTNYYS